MPKRTRSLFDPALLRRAAADSVRKLSPAHLLKNPVMFVTMIGGRYDPNTGVVQLANAGHLPALVEGVVAP